MWEQTTIDEEPLEPDPESVPEQPKSRCWNRGAAGVFARRAAKRITTEQLLSRASLLPEVARGLLTAYYDFRMPAEELAAVHRVTVSELRRRVAHWRDVLGDPSFLLVAEFGERLPKNLSEIARDYWIHGLTMRQIASARSVTIHRVRTQLAMTRSLLLVAMSRRQEVPAELAKGMLGGRL